VLEDERNQTFILLCLVASLALKKVVSLYGCRHRMGNPVQPHTPEPGAATALAALPLPAGCCRNSPFQPENQVPPGPWRGFGSIYVCFL